MLEEKVRAAELLTAGQDAQLAKLSAKQIAALRFASDDGIWRPARARRPRKPSSQRDQGRSQDLAARSASHLRTAPR